MKGLWIRVEAHAVDSVIVAQLAESLSIEPVLALGHLTALGGAVAEHTEDGLIADIPNTTIEGWARWRGKRGDFARATREVLQDGDGRLVDWLETMGKLVEKRERERTRKERERAIRKLMDQGMSEDEARKVLGLSADNLQNGRGESDATVRNGTERNGRKTTTRRGGDVENRHTPRARADSVPHPDSFDGIMQLVVDRLYVPDGQPPEDWDMARDGSILRELARTYNYLDIGVAVSGLAILRDYPGKFGDVVDWLKPKTKATLRALYNTRTGVLPMFNAATMAYWKHAETVIEGKPE